MHTPGYERLESLILRGPESGAHFQHRWQVAIGEHPDPMLVHLVSFHESMHDKLNTTTGYGAVLVALSLVADLANGDPKYSRLLVSLVARSREAHECYATFMSTIHLANSDDTVAATILSNAPEYNRYYKTAASFTPGLRSGFLRSTALSTVVRFCMQSHVIEEVANRGLTGFVPSAMRSMEYPDTRLAATSTFVDERFWRRALEETFERYKHLPGWDLIQFMEEAGDDLEAVGKGALDQLILPLTQCFYDHLIRRAALAGFGALEFNGHQAPSLILEGNVNEMLLKRGANVRVAARTDLVEVDDTVDLGCKQFQHERYIIRPAKLLASLDLPPTTWGNFVQMNPEEAGLFLVVRTPEMVQTQFKLLPNHEAELQRCPSQPMLFVRETSFRDSERIVRHFLIDHPRRLAILAEEQARLGRRMVCTIALRAVGSTSAWVQEWIQSIQRYCYMSFLIDYAPWTLIERIAPQYICYSHIDVDDSDFVRHALLFTRLDGEVPFVLPCTFLAANNFIRTCARQFGVDRIQIRQEPLTDSEKIATETTVQNLFSQEYFFEL